MALNGFGEPGSSSPRPPAHSFTRSPHVRLSSIRLKIVLLSGLCLLGVVALIVGMNIYQTNQNDELVSNSSNQLLTASVQNLLQAKAAEQAVRVQKTFGESLTVITALADQIKDMRVMAAKRSLDAAALREELNQSLKTAFERNDKVLGIWLAFEPNGLDGKDSEFVNDAARQSNEAGRFATYWSRAAGSALNTIMVEEDMTKTTLSVSGTPYNSWYTCPRDNKRTCLLDPYADTVGGKEMLMTTISVPLIVDGKAIGVVGVDIALDALQAAAVDSQRNLFNNAGHMLIVSGSGVLGADSSDATKVGKKISDTLGADGKDLLQLVSSGTPKILEQGELIRRCTRSIRLAIRGPGRGHRPAETGAAGRLGQAASGTRRCAEKRFDQRVAGGRGRRSGRFAADLAHRLGRDPADQQCR